MKKNFTFLIISTFAVFLFVAVSPALAQPWSYNFGSGSGVWTTGFSNDFLPTPATGGGNARVRVGTGGGAIHWENPSVMEGFGSGSSLRIVAPTTSGPVNKFSIYSYSGLPLSSIKFRAAFADSLGNSATAGNFFFYSGNGNSFQDGETASSAQVMAGLRFVFTDNDSIIISRRSGSLWHQTSFIDTNVIAQSTEYRFEIYANNSEDAASYDDGNHTVAPYTYDVWINDVKVLNNVDKGEIAPNTNINAFMFYGNSSPDNEANMFIDNIVYDNTFELELPIDLLSFKASPKNGKVVLDWSYENAVNFERFVVEHSAGDRAWSEVASVDLLEDGNVGARSKTLQAVHSEPANGANYYRLKMIDLDGTYKYSKVESVNMRKVGTVMVVNNVVEQRIHLRNEGGHERIVIQFTDMNGRKVTEKVLDGMGGTNDIFVEAEGLEGMFIMVIEAGGVAESFKMFRR